ncbi:hypothetical protein EDB19DRAFT_1674294 [Suillus lakei]|nr:hypothetical protein EDB19DRAFT_1674294 [Suillus lakei]
MEVDIQDTFGAGFIGGMVAAILYGITTLQTYLYYVYYPRDTNGLKVLVAFIWYFLYVTDSAFPDCFTGS